MKGAGLLVFAAIGCGHDEFDPAQVAAAHHDAAIIEVITAHRMLRWNNQTTQDAPILVLRDLHAAPSLTSPHREGLDQIPWGQPATWTAFLLAEERRLRFPPDLQLGFSLLSESETEDGRTRDGWSGAKAGHPGSEGYFYFGPIIVNEAASEAIVMWAWHCGSLCADGWISRLVYENGTWRLAEIEGLWVS